MGAYKAWFCDLQFGLDKGGSKGMRAAQCDVNQEYGWDRKIMRDDWDRPMGVTAWIDERQIQAAVLYQSKLSAGPMEDFHVPPD